MRYLIFGFGVGLLVCFVAAFLVALAYWQWVVLLGGSGGLSALLLFFVDATGPSNGQLGFGPVKSAEPKYPVSAYSSPNAPNFGQMHRTSGEHT